MDFEIFKKHLERYMSIKDINDLISSFSLKQYKGLYLNTNFKMNDEINELINKLTPHPIVNNAYIFDEELMLGKSRLFNLGYFYIQEPSSTIVPYLLDIKDNELILDMCAAPGGKAIYAALKNKNGIVIANDISNQRAQIIIENEERMGIDNMIVTSSDFTDTRISNKFKNTFDKIILDAPCSGSGMFRKDIKMIEDWNINKVYKCSLIQKQLILNAYDMLKPGGLLAYSTCSYSFEEDEEVVTYLLENRDANILDIKENDLFYRSKELPEAIHMFPNKINGEGQFLAIIKKEGEIKETIFEENKKINIINEYKNLLKNRSNIEINNIIYSLNHHFDAKPLFIIRYGVKAFEIENKIYKPTHHFAKALNELNNIDLKENELINYLKGYELSYISKLKGFVRITYKDNNVGLAKISNNKIKNHYPKGLRKEA